MRVTGVRLVNIACFEDLSLDFTDTTTGEAAPWVVLLGENGSGKSTLLQMTGAGLLGLDKLAVIAGELDLAGYFRDPTEDIDCQVNISEAIGLVGFGLGPTPGSSITRGLRASHFTPSGRDLTDIDSRFICGYGSVRRLTGQKTVDRGPLPIVDDSSLPYRFTSLFGDATGMTNVPDWIAGLYFRAIYPGHTEADEKRFEDARRAILRALPRISSLEVTQDRQVMVTEADTRVPLERLSDGYRGTLSWVGDLIRRLFDAYPESPDPLQERGVVLVDEIDLHLHPRWQRTVVEDVRRLFPNLQFIVTTHSPFVVQDMRPQDRIIVLERSGPGGRGPVVAREESGTLQDWSADQILSSYFGLARGTRGETTQRDEARYERLLDAEAAGSLTDAEQAELERLRTRLADVPQGETPDERAFHRAAEDVIASLQQRRQALEAARAKEQRTNKGNGDSAA